jgi:hypothetical protein
VRVLRRRRTGALDEATPEKRVRRIYDAERAKTGTVSVPGAGEGAIWIERIWNLWAWNEDTLVMIGIGRIGETPARFELAKKLSAAVRPRLGR